MVAASVGGGAVTTVGPKGKKTALPAALARHQARDGGGGDAPGGAAEAKGDGAGDGAAARKLDPSAARVQSHLRRTLDDTRQKLRRAEDEGRKLRKVLAKEMGEDVDLDQAAVNDGWRGRAQQITMLRAKVRRLETERRSGGGSGASAAGAASAGSPGSPGAVAEAKPARRDVDAKAQAVISNMEKERTRAVEQLTVDYQRAQEEAAANRKRLNSTRARGKALENDNTKVKEQLKVLLDKADTDNALIDALRGELRQARAGDRGRGQHAADATAAAVVKATAAAAQRETTDMDRLRREGTRKDKQLEAMGQQMRDLREALREARR